MASVGDPLLNFTNPGIEAQIPYLLFVKGSAVNPPAPPFWGSKICSCTIHRVFFLQVSLEEHLAYHEKMCEEYKLAKKKNDESGQASSSSGAQSDSHHLSESTPQIETLAESQTDDVSASNNHEEIRVISKTGDGDEEHLVVEIVDPSTGGAEPSDAKEESPSEPINVDDEEAAEDPSETKMEEVEIAIGDHQEASGSPEGSNMKDFAKSPPLDDSEAEKLGVSDTELPPNEEISLDQTESSKGELKEELPQVNDKEQESTEKLNEDEEKTKEDIPNSQNLEDEKANEMESEIDAPVEDEKTEEVEPPENLDQQKEDKPDQEEQDAEKIVTIEIVESEATTAHIHEAEYSEAKEKEDDDSEVKSEKKDESGDEEKDAPVGGGEEISERKPEDTEQDQDTTKEEIEAVPEEQAQAIPQGAAEEQEKADTLEGGEQDAKNGPIEEQAQDTVEDASGDQTAEEKEDLTTTTNADQAVVAREKHEQETEQVEVAESKREEPSDGAVEVAAATSAVQIDKQVSG